MNEKFFDLKKEKQDRMINAALKVFASNGYKHASTDDIVTEAGISKGLLLDKGKASDAETDFFLIGCFPVSFRLINEKPQFI